MKRFDRRSANQLRPVKITKNYTRYAEGSVFIVQGHTKVLCNASVEETVPRFLLGSEKDLKLNITDDEINTIVKDEPEDEGKKLFKIQFVKDEKKPFIQKVEPIEKKEDFLQNFALLSVCSGSSYPKLVSKIVCRGVT